MELENITLKEAEQICIDEIASGFDVSRTKARKLFANAIVHNIVMDEIMGQVAWLLNRELDNDDDF